MSLSSIIIDGSSDKSWAKKVFCTPRSNNKKKVLNFFINAS
jgi:hypothetical protein